MKIKKLLARVRAEGLPSTAVRARDHLRYHFRHWADARLDRRYGISTAGIDDDLAGLGADGEHRQHGYGHEPIQLSVFRDIRRSLPIDPARFTFVDFGSGKGRALILAAEMRFREVIGIEFAPTLHNVAQNNVAVFRARNPRASRITLLCQDAATYDLPHGDLVCFFYNPFDAVVMRKVLAKIEQALASEPRRIVVVYRNPSCQDLLDATPFLRLQSGRPEFRVYDSVPGHDRV